MNLAKKRLRRKLLLVFVTPVALVFFATALISLQTTRDALLKSQARALVDNLATFQAAARPLLLQRTSDEKEKLRALVARVAEAEAVHGLGLYDEAGKLIVASAEASRGLEGLDAEVKLALSSQTPVERELRVGKESVLLRIEPLSDVPGVGAVLMTRELASVRAMMDVELYRLAAIGGAGALVIFLITLVLARLLGREVAQLVNATEQIGAGKLDTKMEASRFLELDRVALAFNKMTRSLADAQEKLLTADADRIEQATLMRRAQSLAVVGQVAGSFAHEIGSPLNTILGWSRLSAADESLSPAVRKQFETIAKQCERITRIVERMLAVARPAKDGVGKVDFADVVREVTTFLAPEIRLRKIELRVLIAESLPPLIASRDRLVQVVMNLCINAVQAQPKGGILRLTLSRVPQDEGEGEQIQLEVADAGPGIAEADREKIFEPFYSTKADRGGTGLGLPIVADVVREAGGKVEVGKAPEGGALFRVILPAGPRG